MLDDKDRIFTNIYGWESFSLKAAQKRGDWDNTKDIIAKGRDGLQSPIMKFLPDATVQGLIERLALKDGDLVFFGADKKKVVNDSLAALRVKIGHDLKLAKPGLSLIHI